MPRQIAPAVPVAPGAALLLAALLLSGCDREPEPDAYGTFEATEVVVSAQTTGQVLRFTPVEGMQLERGAVVALIDTAQLVLERDQLRGIDERHHRAALQLHPLDRCEAQHLAAGLRRDDDFGRLEGAVGVGLGLAIAAG